MLSHPPPNRQSPASFDQVTCLPPKNASAPLRYPDARWSDIPVPQVSPIRYMFACQKSQRSMPCNMVKVASPGVGFSAVAILGGWWFETPLRPLRRHSNAMTLVWNHCDGSDAGGYVSDGYHNNTRQNASCVYDCHLIGVLCHIRKVPSLVLRVWNVT